MIVLLRFEFTMMMLIVIEKSGDPDIPIVIGNRESGIGAQSVDDFALMQNHQKWNEFYSHNSMLFLISN